MSIARILATEFERVHGHAPQGLFAAPGRVNLIGEHTDYNDGFVLPLALRQRVVIAAGTATGNRSSVRSMQQPGELETFSATSVAPGEVSGWAAYAAGMFWSLRTAGHQVQDLDLILDGDIPLGAGLSSSAALECAVGVTLAGLAGLPLDATALARAAQRAENEFVGAPTGIMDQMASMHGRAGLLVFLDTRSLDVQHVPFRLAEAGLTLLVVDTRSPHALVDGQYGERRASCRAAARLLGVPALRDVPLTGLDDALDRLPDDLTRRRTRHVVTENARVLAVVRALRSGTDPRGIGAALSASHASMRDDFEITVPPVDLAVETSTATGAYGARMTGGGFGGCVIALVEAGQAAAVFDAIRAAFADEGFAEPQAVPAAPSAGAVRLR